MIYKVRTPFSDTPNGVRLCYSAKVRYLGKVPKLHKEQVVRLNHSFISTIVSKLCEMP